MKRRPDVPCLPHLRRTGRRVESTRLIAGEPFCSACASGMAIDAVTEGGESRESPATAFRIRARTPKFAISSRTSLKLLSEDGPEPYVLSVDPDAKTHD